MKVLVTGASGFVGSALVKRLSVDARCQVLAVSRTRFSESADRVEWVVGPELGPDANWQPLLAQVDIVVHLAARVHDMSRPDEGARQQYQRVNVDGVFRLACQAAECGVKRLIFLSTVKVNGEEGHFGDDSAEDACDAYGRSKQAGERALRDVSHATGLDVVVIRSPLVYGPGAKANFRTLMAWVRRGIPLPLGAIANRRSLVGIDNLVDLIVVCLDHPAAAGETFFVSDGEDVSTPELLKRLAHATGVRSRLVPVPTWCLRVAAFAVGQSAVVARLTGSLSVDISKPRRLLGWVPPVPMDEGLRRVARDA